MLKINGKNYDFRDNGKYTRAFDHGHAYFVCNAPESVPDEEAMRIINGGGIEQPWGYMTIPKDNMSKYEVK